MGAAGTSGEASDNQFNRVNFLSHFEGSNNGVNNVFDDGSTNNYTVIAAGNVTQGSFGPFARPDGEWGVSFDGDSDYLQFAESSDFAFGTGDFTFECFFFMRDAGSYDYLMTFGNNTNADSIGLYIQTGLVKVYNGGAIVDAGSTTVTLNTWHHVAVVRISSTLKMYLDGNQVHSVSNSSNIASTGGANIARWGLISDGQYFNGVISNARVVKGTGVYTGNFTPSTSKLTAITNTKLLTCQSNRFVDNSATGHTVTPYVTSAVTAFGPFLSNAVYDATVNGASAYMDGSGDTLRVAWTAADIVNQNFTLEYWLYYTQTSGYASVSISGSSGGGNAIGDDGLAHLSFLSTNGQVFTDDGQSSGSGPDTGAGGINGNSWNHLALVRVSDDMFTYINGVKAATKAINTSLFDEQSVELGVGVLNNIKGYVTDVRLVTSAVYTGNTYTVPTAPLAAITNTKVLLNMADGQAIDSAAQNNLTLFGNAKISTAQAKFGDTSLLLDGTGDAAQIDTTTNSFAFGTGDYTVEMWLYLTAVNENDQIFDMRTSDSSVNPGSYLDSSARPNLYISGGVRLTSNTAISANTWTHFAICRASGTTRIFQAGQVTGTLNSDTYNIVAGKLMLGARYNSAGTNNGQGHWEDVRVSNMARYTSNFTAPSAAFADKGQ